MTKPCHSPYCECDANKCTHPGFHDARHLPVESPNHSCVKPRGTVNILDGVNKGVEPSVHFAYLRNISFYINLES